MSRKARAVWLLAAVVLAALDLWSKSLWRYPPVGQAPPKADTKVLIDDWLVMEPIFNPGGVWSLDISPNLLLVATLLAIPAVIAWILAPEKAVRWETAGKILVLGGAIGNGYDRVEFGKVRDFINVYFGDLEGWHWPTFNVADSSLVCGIILLLILSFFTKPGERKAGGAQ